MCIRDRHKRARLFVLSSTLICNALSKHFPVCRVRTHNYVLMNSVRDGSRSKHEQGYTTETAGHYKQTKAIKEWVEKLTD